MPTHRRPTMRQPAMLHRERGGSEMSVEPSACIQDWAAPGAEDGDVIGEFGLEHGVKIFAAADSNHGVRVGQLGEDADFVAIFELRASGHRGF